MRDLKHTGFYEIDRAGKGLIENTRTKNTAIA